MGIKNKSCVINFDLPPDQCQFIRHSLNKYARINLESKHHHKNTNSVIKIHIASLKLSKFRGDAVRVPYGMMPARAASAPGEIVVCFRLSHCWKVFFLCRRIFSFTRRLRQKPAQFRNF